MESLLKNWTNMSTNAVGRVSYVGARKVNGLSVWLKLRRAKTRRFAATTMLTLFSLFNMISTRNPTTVTVVSLWEKVAQSTVAAARDHHPRCVMLRSEFDHSHDSVGVVTIRDVDFHAEPSKDRTVEVSSWTLQEHDRIETNSNDYRHSGESVLETEDCKAQYPWQLETRPTCNAVHEVDMIDIDGEGSNIRFLANGYWRDVWRFQEPALDGANRVLKTLRYVHRVSDERNFDRHRRDAQ